MFKSFYFCLLLLWQVPGVTDVGLKPRHIKKVAVIGGGLMGSGIATALLLSNINVVLKEVNADFLAKGIKSIQGSLFLFFLFWGYARKTIHAREES